MSKNSNKKQLNSRLNSVFSDIDKPQAVPGLNASSDISGWIWEMTPQGIITGCSPDIEIFLEIPSHKLIGTEITSFSDFNFEAANLPSNSNRALMPTTVTINFFREDGSIVPTTTYIMGKLNDDSNLLSWRGITSVLEAEETPTIIQTEPDALEEETPMGLITLDDMPEIPQPDESVMDVWTHNEKDTSPLPPLEQIKDSPDAKSSEETSKPAAQKELETLQDASHSINPDTTPTPTASEIEIEEVETPFGTKDVELEGETANLFKKPSSTQVETGETEEVAPPVVESDVPVDSEPQREAEVFAPESKQPSTWVPEFAQPRFEAPKDEPPAEVEEPSESDAQDEIETVRYTNYPVTADQISQFNEETDDSEPEKAEIFGEAAEPTFEGTDNVGVTPPTEETPLWKPEFTEPGPEGSQTFIPLSNLVQSEPDEAPQVESEEPVETTPETARFEVESPVSDESHAWTAEFQDSSVEQSHDTHVDETIERQEVERPIIQEQIPVAADPETDVVSDEMEEQAPEIEEAPAWVQQYADQLAEEAQTLEPVDQTFIEAEEVSQPQEAGPEEETEQPEVVGKVITEPLYPGDQPTWTSEPPKTTESPKTDEVVEQPSSEMIPEPEPTGPNMEIAQPEDIDEVISEPLEIDNHPAWTPDYSPTDEVRSIEETPLTEEPAQVQRYSEEPDTQPLKPFEKEMGAPVNRVDSVSMIPDLDLKKEELESPTEDDSDKLSGVQKTPSTGPMRRPMIDTASLIPSLLKDTKPLDEPDTDSLSIEDFLKEVEEESIRVDTKELETLTSSDGIELSISRGVQELLKIVDDNPNREWKEDELQLVEQVHTQLELALENANLFQQTQLALAETDERARQLRLLNQMSEEISQTEDLLEIYGIVVDKTVQIFNGQRASITILTEDHTSLEVVAATGDTSTMPVGTQFPLKDTSNEIVVRENRVFIPPSQRDLNLGEVSSTMIGPIMVTNNVIGTLNVGSKHANAFNDRDANFLTQLLSIMNASVENRRLFDQIETALSTTEEQARRLAVLNQLGEKLTLAETFDQVIKLILDYTNQIIPADEWAYTHVNNEKNTYELFLSSDRLDDLPTIEGTPISMTQPLENSIVGRATKDRRTIIEFNCANSNFDDVRLWADERGIRTAMSTPILVGNKVIGVLNIGSKQQSAYTIQEENIMLSITSLAGSTIDNRQLLGQIQKRSLQLETSAEVSRVASTMLDPTELLPRVVELIKEGFGLYYAGIFLIDESGEITGEPGKWAVLRAGTGEAGQQMISSGHKLEIGGESMIGTSISTSQARITLSVGEEERFFRNPYLPNTRSEMALPLTSRGQVLGALTIQSEIEDAFKPEDITALQTMADQLANTIENARLFEQTEIRAEELTVLNEMARGFTQTMNVEELIENTYQFTGRLVDSSNFYMVLYYPEEQFYEIKLLVEDGQKISPPNTRVKLGNGLTDWIINNKLPVLIPSDAKTHLMALGIELNNRIPASWLGVPMLLGSDVTGVIVVQNYNQANTYNSHSLDLLIAVSSQAAVAIDNARRFQATQTRARHEEILRRVTTQVHSTSDPEAILRTAVREVSDALGKPAFVKLNLQDKPIGLSTGSPPEDDHNIPPQQTPPAKQPESGDQEAR